MEDGWLLRVDDTGEIVDCPYMTTSPAVPVALSKTSADVGTLPDTRTDSAQAQTPQLITIESGRATQCALP